MSDYADAMADELKAENAALRKERDVAKNLYKAAVKLKQRADAERDELRALMCGFDKQEVGTALIRGDDAVIVVVLTQSQWNVLSASAATSEAALRQASTGDMPAASPDAPREEVAANADTRVLETLFALVRQTKGDWPPIGDVCVRLGTWEGGEWWRIGLLGEDNDFCDHDPRAAILAAAIAKLRADIGDARGEEYDGECLAWADAPCECKECRDFATIVKLREENERLSAKIAADAEKVAAWDVWEEALSRPGVEATEYDAIHSFEGRREYSIVWDYTDPHGGSHEIEGRGPTHWAAILDAAQDLEAHIARAEGEGEKP